MKCPECGSETKDTTIVRLCSGTKIKLLGINRFCTSLNCKWERDIDGKRQQVSNL